MKLSETQIHDIAEVIGNLAVTPIFATFIWAILILIFGLSVTWLQVLGGLIIINLLKSLIFFNNK